MVEGYDERIPSILLMMQRFLVENKGRDQVRDFVYLSERHSSTKISIYLLRRIAFVFALLTSLPFLLLLFLV